MTEALALRPGTVIDAEFEEPTPAQVFPEPPHGLAYFIYGGAAYLVEVGGLSLAEDIERNFTPQHYPIVHFLLHVNGRARKVATL